MSNNNNNNNDYDIITLRVTGLGHTMTLDVPKSMTLEGLHRMIEKDIGLPVKYQRLLTRGIKLDDSDEQVNQTLHEIGIVHRTKIILMHSPIYAKEKDIYNKLIEIEKEIIELEKESSTKEPIVISELGTRICCKLDQIDVMGSTTLRTKRKELIQQVERLEEGKGK